MQEAKTNQGTLHHSIDDMMADLKSND